MNKRGSHVGVMLSFVIFVTFLAFLYSVIEPATKVEKDKQFILNYLGVELDKMFSANLTSVTISIEDEYTLSEDCLKISQIEEIEGLNIIVKDKNNNPLNFKVENSDLKFEHNDAIFFKIYYSNEQFNDFSTNLGTCLEPEENEGYSIELVKTNMHLFETKIDNITEEHGKNYERLKERLKILEGTEFGFSLIDNNRDAILKTEDKEVSINVYVDETPIQYVDEEANIKSGFLIIKVW
ncbi:MAG: hypothetical protein QF567_01825 [Candidatus Pacearchaeota archaeon]|jgi:hypothetical protein|nr:hypothetical protein [Candidatus Pacearchaeota archaeon]MBT96789.1 hypothetical protein [Candidatus Pacearchaeota archaeon]MDP7520950.1 hypothetical protein [Candidatus Pacearchaeota archaeon]|tara:strand:+ start:1518 stop:2231 length:714 start_codon:yes stop_codon:yes gene_type:complete